MAQLITTLGPKEASEMGVILPHEHVFVDLRTWDKPGYAQANKDEVISLLGPELLKCQKFGISAIVECSTVGVGRRADILKAVSQATGFPLVVPTGVYREPWIPPWVHAASEAELCAWMIAELDVEIENSGVRAGWIKLSAGDNGITPCETKVLRAAARAGLATGAVIGSHTIRGAVVRDQLKTIQEAGYAPDRFIWIHTQAEIDFTLHLEVARAGCWIEYDSIGWEPAEDEHFIDWIIQILDAGLGDRLLLSHDRGWFDPAQPGGGVPKPFTYLTEIFLPKLRLAGVGDDLIRQFTCGNPFKAFAR